MSVRQITPNRIVFIGLFSGTILGLTFCGLAEQFPNVGALFLTSTVPVYLSWKTPFPIPLWTWFVAYYGTIGVGISWLVMRKRAFKGCFIFLAILVVVHYLMTFLMAGEIAEIVHEIFEQLGK